MGADGVDVEKIVELLLEARLVNPPKQESGKPSRAEFISRRLQGENSRTTCPVETAPGHMRKCAPESASEQSRPVGSWLEPRLERTCFQFFAKAFINRRPPVSQFVEKSVLRVNNG